MCNLLHVFPSISSYETFNEVGEIIDIIFLVYVTIVRNGETNSEKNAYKLTEGSLLLVVVISVDIIAFSHNWSITVQNKVVCFLADIRLWRHKVQKWQK